MESNKGKIVELAVIVVLMIIAPWISVFVPKWDSRYTTVVVSTLLAVAVLISTLETKPQE